MTFIEVLVSIVLLGTAVVATLTALRVTVIGSETERDHARAHQWLQSAVGAIAEADYVPCDDPGTFATAQEHMIDDYLSAVRDETVPPPDWDPMQISVLSPIEVWDGNRYWTPAETSDPDDCFKDDGYSLQLITVEVRDTEGEIVESVQVVKGE